MKRTKIFLGLFLLLTLLAPVLTPFASATVVPNVESSKTPDIKRSEPIAPMSPVGPKSLAPAEVQLSVPVSVTVAPILGPNLISNPSVENAGTNGLPSGWFKGGYGANTRVLTYSTTEGVSGSKALKVSVTNYIAGDAKWYFTDVPVAPSKQYQFTDSYLSDATSILTARYALSSGGFIYKDLATLPAQSAFTQAVVKFTPPPSAVSVTFFHLLKSAGNLTTDEFSLNEVTTTTPPPDQTNLISNPDLEQVGTSGRPAGWLKGGYGVNTRVLTYPAAGVGGSVAVKTEITSYTSGDAKWYFAPVSVTPGSTYTYSGQFLSNVSSDLVAQFQNSSGSYFYQDLGNLPAANSFQQTSVDFIVPAGATGVTIFHLIQSVGALTIDNASLRLASTGGGDTVFDTGAVTLRFDDNWLSQQQNAVPKLNSAGLKGTFYVVTKQIYDNGYTGFMSKSQIINLANQGHEIGAHTRTHPYLTSLSTSAEQGEIAGSRQDLLSWGVGAVGSFAYPYGDYDSTTISTVQNAGFASAVATIDGYVSPFSDSYQLERLSMESDVTFAQAKQWIDAAIANKSWLVLAFHEINTSGGQYSTTPAIFNQIVDYLAQKNIKVVTISEGAKDLP